MDPTITGLGTAQYCFPILKSQEILSCIGEIGVDVTQPELANPIRHKEKLRLIWLAMVRVLLFRVPPVSFSCCCFVCCGFCGCEQCLVG
jgi:hypothetical protein